MDESHGRGKPREEDGRDRRGERRGERGGRKRERRGRENRDKDRGKRIDRNRHAPAEKQDSSPQISAPMKPPIILTKPMAEKVLQEAQAKEQQQVVIAIQKRDDTKGASSVLPASLGPASLGPASLGPASLGPARPTNIESSANQSQPVDLSPRRDARNDQQKTQLSASAPLQSSSVGSKVDQVITGLSALHATPHITMRHPAKVVDDSFYWNDKALTSLLEQTDFVVVGVVGYQGVGKSTVLSMLGGAKSEDIHKSGLLFRPQGKQDVEKSLHRTEGIDLFVTSERLILLDCQPLLSPSVLDRFLRHEKKVPSDFGTAETCVEMQSLQILTFLYAVCHVVVVVMDHFADLSLFKFLKTAEMLKPSTVAHSGQDGSQSSNTEDLDEYFPNIVFVYNRCDHRMFQTNKFHEVCQATGKFFGQSRLKLRGNASILRANILPYCKLKQFNDYQDLNIFLLPEYDDREHEDPKSLVTTYRGHPSFLTLITIFRSQVLSTPRQHLTHHLLTERTWFHYAARTWDAVKKSPLLSEYQRLLTT